MKKTNYISNKFIKIVAKSYNDQIGKYSTEYEKKGWGYLKDFINFSYTNTPIILSHESYSNVSQLIEDVSKNAIKVYVNDLKHPIFNEIEIIKQRVTHDLYHIKYEAEFNLEGEIIVFEETLKDLREYLTRRKIDKSDINLATEALYTEIVGQTCYKLHYKEFPYQICKFLNII